MAASDSTNAVSSVAMWGSVSALGGETISIDWTVSSTGSFPNPDTVTAEIYNSAGVIVESFSDNPSSGGGSGTFTSSPLAANDRYIIRVTYTPGFDDVTDIAADFEISSSGTMTVNPIAAAYDVGLTCPALLSCGDSCP